VDHALRHGDSLVGLNYDQIRAFHWQAGHKGEQIDATSVALNQALGEAIGIRQKILDLAADPSPDAQKDKKRLLGDADDALNDVRLIADLVVGAFFACDKDKDREKERTRRLDLVQRWLSESDLNKQDELKAELRALQSTLLETQVPFHWHLEFPEVFYLERPDPLDGGKVNGAAMMDAFVGNPPFLGGSAISSNFGDAYRDWLLTIHESAHGNADLSAHFYRRPALLIGSHGTIGLIATNTIGQGDTRSTGLQYLVYHGFQIFGATVDMPWPGDAAVTVSVVQLAKGNPAAGTHREFNERYVEAINSRLRPRPERPDPLVLALNSGKSFLGSKIYGQGFTLTPDERDALIQKIPRNAERIFPYLGGEEVNSSPTQSHDRYVISFGQMELEEAEKWPDLIEIVREKVKPERDKNNREVRRKYWWRFGEVAPALYAAIAPLAPLDRCLVTSRVSKHLMFGFQPSNRIFSEQLYVLPLATNTPFAVLQSRIHEFWARLLSSTMEDRLRYAASDCFETFPFPAEDPRTVLPELETLGEQLYQARAAYMLDTDQGLTKTYNALKDPHNTDPRILALRTQHEEMDRAVLRAYSRLAGVGSKDPTVIGWSDIPVPPFCIKTEEDKAALQAFEDEVIDRLFILNEERAKKEQALGQGVKKGGKGKAASGAKARGRSKTAPAGTTAGESSDGAGDESVATDTARKGRTGGAKAGGAAKGKKGAPPEGQGSLF
ncbi:MAG TPA: type IIL restriction-modification enzyme MmeI, partial [Polyangiaceae bacterium]|nr:type IIL restriction-modification enzyme MmeI [Polyangiaceae bacterium]